MFIAGYEENQARFHYRFDRIILPSAPAQAMIEGLAARVGNPYGKGARRHGPDPRRPGHGRAAAAGGSPSRGPRHIPLADVVAKVLHLAGASPEDRLTYGPHPG